MENNFGKMKINVFKAHKPRKLNAIFYDELNPKPTRIEQIRPKMSPLSKKPPQNANKNIFAEETAQIKAQWDIQKCPVEKRYDSKEQYQPIIQPI